MSASVYYNEIEPYCAAWLKNLMDEELIPAGDIDTRSIEDVTPNDLRGYTQCHFFAGLGGWAYALQLAGWGTRPVWTGSCPCQPFSAAGKGAGTDDKRHLWPAWFHLIRERRPPVILGEQVAAAVGHGWLDRVSSDLEGQDYAIGAEVLPACAVNAPHRRDRLWFVADSGSARLAQRERERGVLREVGSKLQRENPADDVRTGVVVNLHGNRLTSRSASAETAGYGRSTRSAAWSDFQWVVCHDGKARRIQSGLQPLGNGFPARVGRLRSYGNAIVPQVGAAFVTAYMQARGLICDEMEVAA